MNCAACNSIASELHYCEDCYEDIDSTKIELAEEVIRLKKEVKRLKKLSMKRGIPIEEI
jgi:hypothetical protein